MDVKYHCGIHTHAANAYLLRGTEHTHTQTAPSSQRKELATSAGMASQRGKSLAALITQTDQQRRSKGQKTKNKQNNNLLQGTKKKSTPNKSTAIFQPL